MKLNRVAVAFLSLGAAIVLTAGSAGVALAAAGGHPKHHGKPKPAAARQVSGAKLARALLPMSAFGAGFSADLAFNTGALLLPPSSRITLSGMSCKTFEQFGFSLDIGDTASAQEDIGGPDDISNYPNITTFGLQSVMQFATTKAAATYYSEMKAKFAGCPTVTTPDQGSSDGGTSELTNLSLTKTTVGKYQAFDLLQSDIDSDFSQFTWYNATTVVLADTNVYLIYETSGTNDTVNPSLLSQLIKRTQSLYPRR